MPAILRPAGVLLALLSIVSAAEDPAARGLRLLDQLRLAEAAPELEAAVRLHPQDPAAVEGLARLRLLEGVPLQAVTLLRPLATSAKVDDTFRKLFAQALLAIGDAGSAAAVLESLLQSSPSTDLYVLAGQAHRKLNHPQAVADLCERGLRLDPDSDLLERLYLGLPSEVLADRLARRFAGAQARPEPAELIALARVLSDLDPHRKTAGPEMAEGLLAKAIELAPANPAAHYYLGRALVHRATPDAAVAAWEKALALNPEGGLRLRVLTQIARQHALLSRWEQAEGNFRAALEANRQLKTHVPESAFEYFRFLRERSRQEEADILLREILSWNPLFLPARLELAQAHSRREEWADAIREGELVLRAAGDDPDLLRPVHTVLARAYSASARPEKAAPHQRWIEQH